jgi:ribosome maturation factor RimP
MTHTELEQYIGQTVKVQYINLAGKKNQQVMILETISLKKAHFLLYDPEEDIEVSIRFENIIKIEKI